MQRLLDAYLGGRWDEFETLFQEPGRQIPAGEQPKVSYMRQSIAECRPAWWQRCKAGENFAFTAVVWGRSLPTTFAPSAQMTTQYLLPRGQFSLALTWPTADMDSPTPAEHGFSKGDLFNRSIWSTLGTAEAWSAIPLKERTGLSADENARMQRYLDFRGSITSLYHGTPNARRQGLCLCLGLYEKAQVPDQVRMSREAAALMFMSEVIASPARFPSIQLPKTLPSAENVEKQLARELRPWVEKHAWTLVEDKLLRDAIATLATTNGRQAQVKGQITLSNGLVVDLDPEKDQLQRPQRDQWFQSRLAAAGRGP